VNARRIATGAAAGVAGGAALIAALSALARVVGFGRQLVYQAEVGESLLGTVYTTINLLPNVVFEIVAGGALAAVVVPLLAAAAARGDAGYVKQTTSALLGWTLAVLVPVAVIGVAVAGPVADFMLQGQGGPEAVETGREFLLIFLPQIPLYGIAVVTAGALQAHRRFLAAALGPVVSSVLVATAYLVFGQIFTGDLDDLSTLDRRSELVLAGGTTLGVLGLALTTLVPLLVRVTGLTPTLRFPPGAARRAYRLAAAGIVTLIAQQFAYLTANLMANRYADVGGAVTYANSWLVYLLPYAVLAVPIATAAFPRLAEHAEREGDAYATTLARSTRAVVAACAAGSAILVATAWPVARFFALLTPGEGRPDRMAWALLAFAPGLIGYGLVALLGRALFARGHGRSAATATTAGWAVAVVAAVVTSSAVGASAVIAALGGAHTLGMTLAGGLLIGAVARDSGRAAVAGLARSLLTVVPLAALGGLAGRWVAAMFAPGGYSITVAAGVVAAVVAVVVVGAGVALTASSDLKAVLRR
jgi:putative peptidoglycan lipid II flippase